MIVTCEGSPKEWQREQQDEKETCSDGEDSTPPVPPVRRRRSRVHGGFRSEGRCILFVDIFVMFVLFLIIIFYHVS